MTERNDELTQLVKSQIVASEAVPFPGGHGVRFPELRVRDPGSERKPCPGCRAAPGHAARAYLLLALLGKRHGSAVDEANWGKGKEKWFASRWLDLTNAWWAQRMGELGNTPGGAEAAHALSAVKPRHRWRWLLEAVGKVAKESPGLTGGQRALVSKHVDMEWLGNAQERLAELVKKRRGTNRSVPMAPPLGLHLGTADAQAQAQWKKVGAVLGRDGARADLLLAAYMLHVFHASVGVHQVSLLDGSATGNPRQARRRAFYAALLDLLRHSCTAGALREGALRMAHALSHTPLFDSPSADDPLKRSDRKLALKVLGTNLPACFKPYEGAGAVLLADAVAQVVGDRAQARLTEAHHLAEMLADQLIDPLRVRATPDCGPGFGFDCYRYANSRIRYRRSGSTPAPGDAADDEAQPAQEAATAAGAYALQMSAFFNYLCNQRIDEIVRLHLGDVHRARWPCPGEVGSRCAMCHVQAAAETRP